MPRKSRIDVPGALHHVMARSIERNKIFRDDFDRDNFLERRGVIVQPEFLMKNIKQNGKIIRY